MLELSVVIPTFNRLDTLRFVVPSLLAQTVAPDSFEILVCDSNSTDGTAEYLAGVRAEHPNVRHIPHAYSGRAAARNGGVRAATGDVVLFNDADILADPELMAQHLRHHRERRRIAVVGWEVQVKSIADYEYKRDHPAERGHLHPPSRKTLRWLYFLTGNASVRRDDLLEVGAFDESFTGYGHEDLELGYRLAKAGVPILYEPAAINYHCQDVAPADQKEKMKLAGRSTVRFWKKHPRFDVMLNLGMTPLSLGLHSALTNAPAVLGFFDKRAATSRFARNLVEQYYYVSGMKSALDAARDEEAGLE
ncbi:MAG: glycosyltransferase [Candidatus Eremiobacteraeota bacterium]|nr:glycosyltransferase [Candidatus Eremiobacteraeota bacterium]